MDNNLKQAAALLGKKGGEAKVPKGFAALTKKERREMGRAAVMKRWAEARKKSA